MVKKIPKQTIIIRRNTNKARECIEIQTYLNSHKVNLAYSKHLITAWVNLKQQLQHIQINSYMAKVEGSKQRTAIQFGLVQDATVG